MSERLAFIERVLCERDRSVAKIAVTLCCFYNGIGIFTYPLYVIDEYFRAMFLQSHIAFLVILVLWGAVGRRWINIQNFVLFLELATIAFFAWVLHQCPEHGTATEDPLLAASALMVLSVILISLTPYHDRRVSFTGAAVCFLSAILGWNASTSFVLRWLFIDFFAVATALYFYHAQLANARRQAGLEFEAREQAAAEARIRMEHEMALARDIQDSLSPPSDAMLSDNVRVICHQAKHDKVGGDWMAIRKDGTGAIYFVVADATGKGLPAALVIHAVQSLWADELNRADFDPPTWIRRVNRTLSVLGQTRPHSLTLGLGRITTSSLTYWSAGHLPLFIAEGGGTTPNIRSLLGRGPILGLASKIHLEPATMPIMPGAQLQILLGSDGVFAKGSRSSRRDISQFLTQLETNPHAAVETDIEDDRTLVWIKMDAA